ncbi:peptidoglycan/LPS O-acetylase OafA/YrhL [Branchiibius hedensis]|uniref:Peptidoglycan/LPS O-acetylase OafA/YrhL, contains acyltransferase and SGNH-hydrolase domains n=1 Tax=Branchiibius hedensis TaxID=672460 RepID=A0A2Y9C1U8_9MICO|nr:acyltransferase [Branchiibius hedensis]PWJ26151.1 peptidoglycan/LPS O-acetylase OafA/YrhL [Branchiibius hedensis]SSA34963.1 Peptidoglycan/LPS O-acetylase OafA/YrhL, contains acyltransferase and SGNH-hydrolase domains [Branchiibius hedensis]
MTRVRGIDALRGIGALAVFGCHINQYWAFLHLPGKLPQLSALAAHGVDLFIVISGFCLALPMTRHRPAVDAIPFWKRRALRILPAYYVALLAAFALAALPPTWPLLAQSPAGGGDLAAYALFVQAWIPSTTGAINGSLWSVSLEVHLYLLFPLLVAWWRRWGLWSLLAASFLLSVAWSALGPLAPGTALGYSFTLPDRLSQFVAGMCCAWVFTHRRTLQRRWLVALLAVGLVMAAAVDTAHIHLGASVVWAIPCAAAVLLFTGPVGDWFAHTPMDGFGLRSYSFYLVHQPVIQLAAPLVALLPSAWPVYWLVGGAVVLLVTTLVARVLYRWVELPSHRLSRKARTGRAGVEPVGG